MTYFMNPFNEDFYGNWVIDDRHHHPTFKCPRNAGRGDDIVISWADGPYDLDGTGGDGGNLANLTIQWAMDKERVVWVNHAIDVSGATPAATTAIEVMAALNADTTFASYFTATLENRDDSAMQGRRVAIRQRLPVTRLKFFIVKGGAEEVLLFNARAGVSELPTYFDRHTIFNRDATTGLVEFADGANMLIALDPEDSGFSGSGLNVDDDIINNAVNAKGVSLGLSSATVQADWELLQGQTMTFMFTRVVDGTATTDSTRIEFPAGAKIGDLAKRIVTEVDGSGDLVNEFIMPHTIVVADLITPP